MIYTVKLQADSSAQFVDIFGSTKELILLNPKVTSELNSAGSFDFVMPPSHTYYNLPKILLSNVEVYEENQLIFFGRVSEIEVDFYKQKTVHCEGALAFFNDTIQRPAEWDVISIRNFLTYIVSAHNANAASDRQFTIGTISENLGDKGVYRKLDYETTFEVFKRMIINAEGGYLFVRRTNGVTYLDYLEELPTTGDQPIQYAVNLMDLKQTYGINELYTSVIPLGAEDENTGEKLTIASVNSGSDRLDASSDVIAAFGRIEHVEEFSDIDDPTKLKTEGQAWLARQDFNSFSLEVDAAELHYINQLYSAWKLGQRIRILSTPHLIDTTLHLTKVTYKLDKGAKQITVGTKKKQTLTEIYNGKTEEYVK